MKDFYLKLEKILNDLKVSEYRGKELKELNVEEFTDEIKLINKRNIIANKRKHALNSEEAFINRFGGEII
jgi:hypothetical protein